MVAMGFVGKNIECADQLLREGDRDNTERGQKMRQTGLAIISSLIQALPTVPLQGTGYDLATGKPWDSAAKQSDNNWLAPWLRNATEDMRVLMRAYRRERAARPPASGMVQLGEAVRGLADPAAEAGWIVPAAMETRKQRGCGALGNDELQSRAAARHHDRRDGRSEVSSRRQSERPNMSGRTGGPGESSSEARSTIRISPTKKPGCSAWKLI